MRYVTLGDVCKKASSNVAQKDILSIDGEYPIYGASGLIKTVDFYHQEQPYIAIVKDGAGVGRSMLLPEHSSVIGTMQYIIPNELVDIKYLYYAIVHMNLAKYYMGAAIPHIYFRDYQKEPLKLPLLSEQKRIAAIFEKIDSIIEFRNTQLAQLEQVVKSRFIELFGDFKTNPKMWPIVPFTEFAEIDGNMTTDYEKFADYPHIGIDSIEKGTGELKGYRTVREDGVISGKYIFTPQHIIYSKIRPNLNKVALPKFDGLCSADAYPILPNRSNCNRIFLAVAMRSEYYLDYILQFSSRTNLPKVNRKEIAGFRMPLPPLELQEQFATFVEQTDKSKYYSRISLVICQSMASLFEQEWMKCQTLNS